MGEIRVDSEEPKGSGAWGNAERREAALVLISAREAIFRRTARRYSLCVDDAEDAYQRAVEILLTKAPPLDADRLTAWMQTVTRREALAVRRQRERLLGRPPPVDGQDHDPLDSIPSERIEPGEGVERRERVVRSGEALAALKPHEAEALMLKAQGYSYEEIGQMTGWSYTKINRLMAEGRKRFLEVFGEIEAGDRCEEYAGDLLMLKNGERLDGRAAGLRRHLRACASCRAELSLERSLRDRAPLLIPVLALRDLWERAQGWVSGGAGGRIAAGGAKFQALLEASAAQKAAATVVVAAAAISGTAIVRSADAGRSTAPPGSVAERTSKVASAAQGRETNLAAHRPSARHTKPRRSRPSRRAAASAATASDHASPATVDPVSAAVGTPETASAAPAASSPAPPPAGGGGQSSSIGDGGEEFGP